MVTSSAFKTNVFGSISGGRTTSRLLSRCLSKTVRHFWIMRSAIVTGGQGFIGGYLVKVLQRKGVNVKTLGRRRGAEKTHFRLDEPPWGSPALDRVLVNTASDCIFHLAGTTRGTSSELTRINVGLTLSLLRALRRTGLRPLLVVAGSAAEYGSAIIDGEPICETATCAPLSD